METHEVETESGTYTAESLPRHGHRGYWSGVNTVTEEK
jgi:hypothetical protein